MNRLKKAASLFLIVIMLASFIWVPNQTVAEETTDENVTEYVLILANTNTQHTNDPEYNRAAAAKLFVDMLPADNAKLSIFVISNKDTGSGIVWGKGKDAHKYSAVNCYQLALNRDGIYEPNSHNRMQCVYQIGIYGEEDLTIENREEIKEQIDWIYHDMPTENAYNDLHCAVYAAMDYLAFNSIKNACILMLADESTADHTGFPRADGTSGDFYWAINNYDDPTEGKNPEGDTSFVQWIRDRNSEINSNGGIPYNWSFNWIDMTTPDDRTAKKISTKAYEFFSGLCESTQIGGEFHQVKNSKAYSSLPAWTVSILRRFTGNISPVDVPVANGKCSFELDTVYSEVNIAVTGSNLDGVTLEYTSDDQPPVQKNISFSSSESGYAKTLVDKDDTWFTCEIDKELNSFTYANIKLVLPNPGQWKLSFEGTGTDDITVQIVKAQDAELQLRTANAGKLGADGVYYQTFANKLPVTFQATFWYNGRQITHQSYLNNNKTHTWLYYQVAGSNTIEKMEPTLGNGELLYTYTPTASGTCTFWTQVEASEYFSAARTGDYTYNFTFSNNVPRLKDGQKGTVEVNWTLDTDMSFADYLSCFTDDDGEDDSLQLYMLTCDSWENEKNNEQPVEVSDFVFHIPNTKGEYEFSVRAIDPEGGISTDKLIIKVHVFNETPALLDAAYTGEEIYLVADVPDVLIQAGLFADEDRIASYFYDKLFTDADGDELSYEFVQDGNKNDTGDAAIVSVAEEKNEEGRTCLTLKPLEGAELPMTVTVIAKDHTGSASPAFTVTVHVNSLVKELLVRYWWVLAILIFIIIVIIILKASRRVHGSWEVTMTNPQTQESCYHRISSLPATKNRNLRKTTVSIKDICNFVILKSEADQTKISTDDMYKSNPVLHGTVLPGKCKMEFKTKSNMKVYINGEEKTKSGNIKIRPRVEIMLEYMDKDDMNSLIVTMSFH